MFENVKIGIIGGDMRQIALARRFADIGFETAVWGLGNVADKIGNAVRCADWKSTIEGSATVILPLPFSSDGVRINCPLEAKNDLRFLHIAECLPANCLLLGGKMDASAKEIAEKNHIPLIDYFECEELQIKNSIPTAEGAIEIAMRELQVTIFGCRAAVVGYGRVGKALAMTLHSLGANVTVAARSGESLAAAEISRMTPMKITKNDSVSTLEKLKGFDVIFNTVPAKLFDREMLGKLTKDTLIIDLASGLGGVDFKAAQAVGIKAIHALSLPGKVAPFTAGAIICDCVMEVLAREGVITRL